jgi:hypothetical protein
VISISASKAGLVVVMVFLLGCMDGDSWREKERGRALSWRGLLSKNSAEAFCGYSALIPDTAAPFAVAIATAADGAGRGRFANHAAAIQPFGGVRQEPRELA